MRSRLPLIAVTFAAGCASPGAAFDARDLGRPVDAAAPVSIPVAATPDSELSGAVATFAARVPVAQLGGTSSSAWLRADDRAMGSDETAAPAAEPGGGDEQELAKKLSNPIAALISIPFQSNWNSGMGPDGRGKQFVMNVQPVIPISLNEDWNMISRTIVPIIDQEDVVPGTGGQSGVGDITQSLFFSPKAPTESGWIWGVGPVFLIPTAENQYLGGDKWGTGPTAVFLKQEHGWTYGGLVNHVWSFAGGGASEVNRSFIQPFLSYTTPDVWTFSLNAESTYDWLEDDLAVPLNLAVAKLVRLGKLPVQFQFGVRYWAERSEFGAEGFGFRFSVTFLLPAGK